MYLYKHIYLCIVYVLYNYIYTYTYKYIFYSRYFQIPAQYSYSGYINTYCKYIYICVCVCVSYMIKLWYWRWWSTILKDLNYLKKNTKRAVWIVLQNEFNFSNLSRVKESKLKQSKSWNKRKQVQINTPFTYYL